MAVKFVFKVNILKNLFRINYAIRITNRMPKHNLLITNSQ